MKIALTILLNLIFVLVNGQDIGIRQKDLINKNDTFYLKSNNKLFNGIIISAFEGEIVHAFYLNGLHFVDSSVYNSNKLQSVIRYKNNMITDRFLFDHNGGKYEEDIYLDDNRMAKESLFWHPNGQLWRIEMYFNGEKSGKWYEWFKNGKLLFEGEFKNGEKFGTWTYYNAQTGKIIRQEKY